jgi:MFS family permease
MKWITTPILRRFGFRQVLILNGLLCALSIGLCALLDADTPIVITLALLLVAGLTRSMQFTALSTLTFAEIEPQERSAATTLLSMLQQLALLIAVAFASLVLTSIADAERPWGAHPCRFPRRHSGYGWPGIHLGRHAAAVVARRRRRAFRARPVATGGRQRSGQVTLCIAATRLTL